MLLSIAFQLAQVLPGLAEIMTEAIHRIQQPEDDQLAMDPGKLFDRSLHSDFLNASLYYTGAPLLTLCFFSGRILLEPLTKFSESNAQISSTVIIMLDALDESDWGFQSTSFRTSVGQSSSDDPNEGHWTPVANLIIQKSVGCMSGRFLV